MKKLIALLLVVAMALTVFAACAPADNNPTTPPATNGTDPKPTEGGDENPTEATEPDFSEHITFTISAIDGASLGMQDDGTESPVWAWLKEKFNFEFTEVWPLDWGNYIDQVRLWLNTDSTPDLFMLDVAAVRYGEYLEWVDAGLLHPYTNYENFPNLKARMDAMEHGKKFIVDGELYAWPAYLDTVESGYTKLVVYKYRTDWAKDVGLYQEDGVYTWDEWWALLDAIQEAAPAGADTIPVMGNSDYAFPLNMTLAIQPNIQAFTYTEENGWVWGPTLPETTTALEFIKEKYDAGIIWKDQPIGGSSAGDLFNAGYLFAAQYDGMSTGGFMGDKGGFEDANPDLIYEDTFEIAIVEGPDGKIHTTTAGDEWSQQAMDKDLSDEKVERWMYILDYLASDEGYYVRNYGIPGTDWEYDENGEAVCLWEPDENGVYNSPYQGTWPWARIAGCNDNFSNYSPNYPAKVQDMILNAMEIMGSDTTVTHGLPVDVQWIVNDEYREAIEGLEESVWRKIAELIVSDNFVADFNAWATEKAAEIQPAIDILNEEFPNG